MVVYESMVFSHGITYRNLPTKNIPPINRDAINKSPSK
jgi:hypothetical protein